MEAEKVVSVKFFIAKDQVKDNDDGDDDGGGGGGDCGGVSQSGKVQNGGKTLSNPIRLWMWTAVYAHNY